MILRQTYNDFVHSPQFIKKQLVFQGKMYQKIKQTCQQKNIVDQGNYQKCAKSYKKRIKSYAKFTQLLLHEREKQFKLIIQKQCFKKLELNDDQFYECFNKQQNKFIQKSSKKDFEYLNLLRNQLSQKK